MPAVQTKIAQHYTEVLNKEFKTNIYIEKIEVTIFGGLKLKNIFIKDHHRKPLIFARVINTQILDFQNLLHSKLRFKNIITENLFFNIVTYQGEKLTNFDQFLNSFDDGKPSGSTFLMTAESIVLNDAHFVQLDYNSKIPKDADFSAINGVVKKFHLLGPDLNIDIERLAFKDYRGLQVKNLSSQFTYTKKNLKLEKLDLTTSFSKFKGAIILTYNREDFDDFNNKVVFDINAKKALIASNDIHFFTDALAKNQVFNLKAIIHGTLNNLQLKNLWLSDNNKTKIIGNVVFKNLLQKPGKGFLYMKGNFNKIESSYQKLITLLPVVLGKKLPTSLSKLGTFDLSGFAEVTANTINTDLILKSALGQVKTVLQMSNLNTIDNANYKGSLQLENFDIGKFLNKKDLGKVTLNVTVDGKGFTEKYLNTNFSGEIKLVQFNNYTYQNITVDGKFKKPLFEGSVLINDPNLKMNFDGIITLQKNQNNFNFNADIAYANLKQLHLVAESTSIFKGQLSIDASGTTINNAFGAINFKNTSYQNAKDIYYFDALNVNSYFKANNERVIVLDSQNSIKGEIQGKFEFGQIQTMIQNSLGSLYTNFKADKLKKGQYLKFTISDFNKVVEILNPKIILDQNATLDGSINGDGNAFKLNFNALKLDAFDNKLDNVQVQIDNKNPLYNAYIQIDSIRNKNYKIRDFSLINVTSKDTLSFRTEFKGGDKGEDFYNFNLYHTIDKNNNNVVGFNKSEMMFKDFLWYVNEKSDDKNKIVFDKTFSNFNFDNLLVTHQNQSILLNGSTKGAKDKNIQLSFNAVNLSKITPTVDKFNFEGNLNGDIFIKQNNAIYQPTAALTIEELTVNTNKLGNLILNIEGDENFKSFQIDSEIENENLKSFKATGGLKIVDEQTLLDLNVNFQRFNLGILSNLGGDVISNIRGFVSGNARLDGNLNDIDYNGRLFVDDTGLTIPYLNVDYLISPNSIIDITQTKFIIQPTKLIDSKFNTEANFEGFIKHKQFSNWELDLSIDSNNFLALNTVDKEDAAYFGKAFINGKATIKGPTSGLVINVNAKSAKNTYIKIPINQGQSVNENQYLHFITANEKYSKNKAIAKSNRNYNGLQLNFDLDITQDATIEVILDRDSGHGMKGKGIGTLFMNINTLGKFEMTGDYQIYEGSYNFKYGGLIDKRLSVKKYGSIVWDGDPLKAILNLEAVYTTNANPAVLIDNPSFNRKIPVEVIIGVKGTITNPDPDFNINFPNVSSVLKSEIETKLNDKDIRQTQALYLLSTGSFLSPEGLNQAQVTNSLYEKAGALFGDLFHDESGKFQLGFDYSQAERNALNPINGRVGVNITSKINERITINGKVGVPTGGVTESAIIGNFEAQYRVNEDGTLNLRLFNRENDINYIGQGIGYTQGVGISYEVSFDTFNELITKIFKKKSVVNQVKNTSDHDDNMMLPDYINLNKDNKNDKKPIPENTTPNKDIVPKSDDE